MFNYNDPLRLAEETQGGHIGDSASRTTIPLDMIDGYRCLEAFGDDLSLEDTPLIDMDDLLITA